MMFRIVFWDVLPCKMAHSSLMMEAVRTSETSVDNHFTRQYIPEDNSEHQNMILFTCSRQARYLYKSNLCLSVKTDFCLSEQGKLLFISTKRTRVYLCKVHPPLSVQVSFVFIYANQVSIIYRNRLVFVCSGRRVFI
jgi:hypothetical protein